MKVLLVAPQSNDTVLGMIGIYCKKAIERLGHDLKIFDFRQSRYFQNQVGSYFKKVIRKVIPFSPRRLSLVRHLEAAKMNSSLAAEVEEYAPDIALILTGDDITADTLNRIRKRGAIIANWFTDSLLDPYRRDFIKGFSSYYDYFFIVEDEEVLNHTTIGARHVKTVPLGCDFETHRTIELSEDQKKRYGSDIVFIGTVKFGRDKILAQVADFDLGIWGYWEEKIPNLRRSYRAQNIFGNEAAKIYNASKIVLDLPLSYGGGGIFEISVRLFEISACGAFALSAKTPFVSDLYEVGKEMVYYENEKDLRERIDYYLRHPEERKSMARLAQERSYRCHTYDNRLKEIFSFISDKG